MPYGTCKICGCTEYNACYHPVHGYCFWLDRETHELCSHCIELANDPEVVKPTIAKVKNISKIKKLERI